MQLQYCVQINANTHVKNLLALLYLRLKLTVYVPYCHTPWTSVSRQMLRMTYIPDSDVIFTLHQQKFCAILKWHWYVDWSVWIKVNILFYVYL